MGTDDSSFCGCLPWGRRRSSPSTNRRPSSAPVAAGGSKSRSILKSTTEPLPAKWRSQAGTSETSSTEGGGSETGNGGPYLISATAFAQGDDAAPSANTVGRGARSSVGARSSIGSSHVRSAAQPQAQQLAVAGGASAGSASGSPVHKSAESGPSAKPKASPFGASDDPRVGSGPDVAAGPGSLSGADAASLADASLRLQDLQQRYRQRTGRASAVGGTAVAGGGPDDRFGSDQMQCDSFTYNFSMYGGRRSSNGGRLGSLPPLPASPARVAGPAGAAAAATTSGAALGVQGYGHVHGNRGPARHQGHAKLDQGLMADKRQKAAPGPGSQDLSPVSSIITTHIPGSLPSMTQPQASPGTMRIHPMAPAWNDAPSPSQPPPTQMAASPLPPWQSWADMEALQGRVQGSAAAVAAAAAASGRSSNPRAARVRFSPQEAEEEQGGGGGMSAGASPNRGHTPRAGQPTAPRQSLNGLLVHRTAHGPAGYSSAAAPVLPLGVRQLARMTSNGTASFKGIERPSSAVSSMAIEAFAHDDEEEEEEEDPPAGGLKSSYRGAREAAGTGHLRVESPGLRSAEGGGRYSLPLYDSIAPGAVLAKAPSFGPAGEPRSTPGCIEPRVAPVQPGVLDGVLQAEGSQRLTPQQHPPQSLSAQPSQQRLQVVMSSHLQAQPSQQHLQAATSSHLQAQPSQQRLQAATSPLLKPQPSQQRLQPSPPPPPREDETKSAPVEATLPKKAFLDGPVSMGASSAAPNATGAAGSSEGGELRPAARLAQQRMAAARQNQEMLEALLASSKRTLDVGGLLAKAETGSAAEELERLGRVQDAVSRLEGIRAAPSQPAAPGPASAGRTLSSRTGSNENAITDFAGTLPPAPNPALGVKPW